MDVKKEDVTVTRSKVETIDAWKSRKESIVRRAKLSGGAAHTSRAESKNRATLEDGRTRDGEGQGRQAKAVFDNDSTPEVKVKG